ncbi:MAG: hypothetical protein ACI8P9_002485 [Parasphingorhabdus sp.]
MEQSNNISLQGLLELGGSGIEEIGAVGFIMVMTVSLLSSFYISVLYLRFYGSRATGSQIHRAFPLLGMSVTAIFICIQFSLPLSLGLLGALSIVRFRTPIKEPEEIGFIMLVIGSSIAAATFSMYFLAILLGFATLALIIQKIGFQMVYRATENGLLIMTVPTATYGGKSEELKKLMNQYLVQAKLESLSKSEDNSVLSYSFSSFKNCDAVELQSLVEDLINPKDINIYLNKQATL